MRKETFHDSFWKFWNYKDLYGKPCKRDSMAEVVFSCFQLSAAVAIAAFEIYGLKFFKLPNFDMLFQLVLTKLNCFRVYRKLITWSSHVKSLFQSYITLNLAHKLYTSLLNFHFFKHFFNDIYVQIEERWTTTSTTAKRFRPQRKSLLFLD